MDYHSVALDYVNSTGAYVLDLFILERADTVTEITSHVLLYITQCV